MSRTESQPDHSTQAGRARTAATALAEDAEMIDRLLVSIRDRIENEITTHRETVDWSHAGSLGHVAEKLAEIDAFLRGDA